MMQSACRLWKCGVWPGAVSSFQQRSAEDNRFFSSSTGGGNNIVGGQSCHSKSQNRNCGVNDVHVPAYSIKLQIYPCLYIYCNRASISKKT